jgi:hypothetical protein
MRNAKLKQAIKSGRIIDHRIVRKFVKPPEYNPSLSIDEFITMNKQAPFIDVPDMIHGVRRHIHIENGKTIQMSSTPSKR